MAKKKKKTIVKTKANPFGIPEIRSFPPALDDLRQLMHAEKERFKQNKKFMYDRGDLDGQKSSMMQEMIADLTAPYIERRAKGILSNLDRFTQIMASAPNPEKNASAYQDAWIDDCCKLHPSYDMQERSAHSIYAIAMWIAEKFSYDEEMRKFLTHVYDEVGYDEDIIPRHNRDAHYDVELLATIAHIIGHRNQDLGKNHNRGKYKNLIIDEYTIKNTHKKDVPSRQRFEKLLSFIPEDEIRSAEEAFEKAFWALHDKIVLSLLIATEKEIAVDQKISDLKKKMESKGTEEKDLLANFLKNNTTVQSFVPVSHYLDAQSGPLYPGTHADEDSRRMVQLSREKANCYFQTHELSTYMQAGCCGDWVDFQSKFGKEIAEIWSDYSLDDPYQILFGFLYAVDRGSEIPWMTTIGQALFSQICGKLPWNACNVMSRINAAREAYESKEENALHGSYTDSLYELRFCNGRKTLDGTKEEENNTNMAQIIYTLCGCTMPRSEAEYLKVEHVLREVYGIADESQLKILSYIIAANQTVDRSKDWQIFDDEYFEDEESDQETNEDEPEESADSAYTEELLATIDKLRKEVSVHKAEAHRARAKATSLSDQLEAMDRQQELDRMELADLRAFIFNREEGIEEEPSNETIAFPYHTEEKIIAFGGHETWTKKIKQKLPDVKFIHKDTIPNVDMIRNADMVWIQPNALCHAYLYKIINEVRRYNIPVRYFSFDSAAKCAEQLVLALEK